EVAVYEQATELREVGAGVQLSANATRVLYALGVGDAARALASEPAGKEIRLWNTGQTWKLFDLGAVSVQQYGYPYWTLWRPDLLSVLADAVRRHDPQAIRLGARCVGCVAGASGARLVLADGSEPEGAAVVGADGVFSQVRRALFGADAPAFSGLLAWRGVIPMSRLPAHFARPVGSNWVGPGRHVVHYPLHRGELMNFVGVVERSDWQVESWTERGTHDECRRDFAGWHEDVHAMIEHIDVPYKWALMTRAPLQRWSAGCATLAGDACHPTLPFLAQGAAMAIEDGLVLARCLQQDRGDVVAAFERYQRARLERTTRVVVGSAENAKRFHDQSLSDAAQAQRYVDREWSEARIRQRYEWLFEYDAASVPL
ncbi:MAG TPA: FAD-dependent monooxygenase, partial [Burkholderiaceae bacterium]|nr:FAD-dependent monooxygenase [Burkholderiaceae bacterium]